MHNSFQVVPIQVLMLISYSTLSILTEQEELLSQISLLVCLFSPGALCKINYDGLLVFMT
ncbi:hypothetical protein B4U79_09418 [Dinothrombium tinctorium]|uniref:Uncharacterized protein n=1 Tax=Dinothrombium tinctorium TaxID=1965070 RepID=A0A443R865_9ACAR|nr:hypothetical protein B4U79_09418 [Dinothrombium tinctorium]